jgi:hypothetical protein
MTCVECSYKWIAQAITQEQVICPKCGSDKGLMDSEGLTLGHISDFLLSIGAGQEQVEDILKSMGE